MTSEMRDTFTAITTNLALQRQLATTGVASGFCPMKPAQIARALRPASGRFEQTATVVIAAAALLLTTLAASRHAQAANPVPQQSPPPLAGSQAQAQSASPSTGQGWRGRSGMGDFPAGARGILGTVTEVTADHYTLKTDTGDSYTVHFSVNTRIMKQPAGQPGARRQSSTDEGDRPVPQSIKPTDIKVGDVLTAGGEVDSAAKSVGAVFIMQLDPERAKQMRQMQANYGKTWLAGRITSIDGTKIAIDGMVDHAPHTIEVDENTSFRQRRDSITLADIQPGEQLRAEGAMKDGVFLATTVNAVAPPNPSDSAGNGPGRPHAGTTSPGPGSAPPK